jgi:uncharacterized membrane protein
MERNHIEQKTPDQKQAGQNRLKSPVVWAAIVAQGLAILTLTGVFDEAMSATVKGIVAGLLEMLVLVGVFNNPTDHDHL